MISAKNSNKKMCLPENLYETEIIYRKMSGKFFDEIFFFTGFIILNVIRYNDEKNRSFI